MQEDNSTLPLHNTALLDRLVSWRRAGAATNAPQARGAGASKSLKHLPQLLRRPPQPPWALIDNFGNHLGRQARLRANALALTRGPGSVGTTYLPPPMRPDLWADVAEAAAWVHRVSGAFSGGAYAAAPLAILYVNDQANLRTVAGPGADVPTLLAGGPGGGGGGSGGCSSVLALPDKACALRDPPASAMYNAQVAMRERRRRRCCWRTRPAGPLCS